MIMFNGRINKMIDGSPLALNLINLLQSKKGDADYLDFDHNLMYAKINLITDRFNLNLTEENLEKMIEICSDGSVAIILSDNNYIRVDEYRILFNIDGIMSSWISND